MTATPGMMDFEKTPEGKLEVSIVVQRRLYELEDCYPWAGDEAFLREVCLSVFGSRSKEKLQFLPEAYCGRLVAEKVFSGL